MPFIARDAGLRRQDGLIAQCIFNVTGLMQLEFNQREWKAHHIRLSGRIRCHQVCLAECRERGAELLLHK